jgi:hypothetical protein
VTVMQALAETAAHPVRCLVRRWNWKAAVLSAAIRGSIFFWANLQAGSNAALRALLVDSLFRIPLVGIYGALTQALRSAEPGWAAVAAVAAGIPAVAHATEFTVHYIAGTPIIAEGLVISIVFSAVSSGFELLAMRHGLLVVGPGANSLWTDMRRVPRLLSGSER